MGLVVEREVNDLKNKMVPTFEDQDESGLFTMKFRLLRRRCEDLEKFRCIKVFDSVLSQNLSIVLN